MILQHGKVFNFAIWSLPFLAFFLSACSSNNSSNPHETRDKLALEQSCQKARSYKKSQPDSALIYAESAITLMYKIHYQNNDTLVSLLKIKASAFLNLNLPDSAISVWEQLRLDAINRSDSLLQALAAVKIGEISLSNSKMYFADKYFREACQLYQNQPDDFYKGLAYGTYGQFLTTKEDYKQAQYYSLKAYGIFQQLDSLQDLGAICIDIGNVFNATGSKEQELKYNREALSIANRLQDTANLISILNNIGLYYKKKEPDSALWYYRKALSLNPPGESIANVLSVKYNIANLYYLRKDFRKALAGFQQVLEISQSEQIYQGIIMASLGISSVYKKTGDLEKSFEILMKAKRLADSTGKISLKMMVMDDLREYYKEGGNYKEAYLLLDNIKTHNDSTLAIDKVIAIHEMDKLFQTEKKELENHHLKAQITANEQNLKLRMVFILILLISLISLGVLLMKAYHLYKGRGMSYNILMVKYQLEKEKREHITIKAEEPVLCSTNELMDQLTNYFRSGKPYLDSKLRVDDVAEKLNTTQKALSLALKSSKNMNFNSFVNQFRIDYAKQMMEDDSYQNYKIEAIARDSGFGSKTSFYAAFEQSTGVKPSYYRSFMMKKESLQEMIT